MSYVLKLWDHNMLKSSPRGTLGDFIHCQTQVQGVN